MYRVEGSVCSAELPFPEQNEKIKGNVSRDSYHVLNRKQLNSTKRHLTDQNLETP